MPFFIKNEFELLMFIFYLMLMHAIYIITFKNQNYIRVNMNIQIMIDYKYVFIPCYLAVCSVLSSPIF